jgi:hypothetical protein
MRYAYVDQQQTLLAGMSRTGNDIFFNGVNVHVRSGSGATNGDTGSGPSVNGLGNLIIGYDEARTINPPSDKTGSHNLVIGEEHNYSSYGGLVAGFRNIVSGPNASVSGGWSNVATGNFSSVSGGLLNTASGTMSSIGGGGGNTASGNAASISGGNTNIASGIRSSVSGGLFNTASGNDSSISGGQSRSVVGQSDWRAGGLFEDN